MALDFNLDVPDNIVSLAGSLTGWLIVIIITSYQYRKHLRLTDIAGRPKLGKIVLSLIVGLFSLAITTEWFGITIKLAILPIGVVLLYGMLRKKARPVYVRYAWIGFAANYIFLVTALLGGFAYNGIYPKEEAATYLADMDKAELMEIHPSAQPATFSKERLHAQLDSLQPAEIKGRDWHYESMQEQGPEYRQERFPYMLTGVLPSWGSGIRAIVYIERDGKGLLVATAEQGYYFRSEEPLLEAGEAQ